MKTPAQLRNTAERARKQSIEADRKRAEQERKEKQKAALAVLPEVRAEVERRMEADAKAGQNKTVFVESTMGSYDSPSYDARSRALFLLADEIRKENRNFYVHVNDNGTDYGVGSDPGPPITSTTFTISWGKRANA